MGRKVIFRTQEVLYAACLIVLSSASLFLLSMYSSAYGLQVVEVEVVGNSVDVGIDKFKIVRPLPSSKIEIENFAAGITDLYHRKGYTTSYVERMNVTKEGILKIYIRESKIIDVEITGVDADMAVRAKEIMVPVEGELYNRFQLQERAILCQRVLELDSIKIIPLNYRDTADVKLRVEVKQSSPGKLDGGIGYEPVYGILPRIGYFYRYRNSAVYAGSEGGYRNGEFKRISGFLKYMISPGMDSFKLYGSIRGESVKDVWESKDIEYTTRSFSAGIGVNYWKNGYLCDLGVAGTEAWYYNYYESDRRTADSRVSLIIGYSDKPFVAYGGDASYATASASIGYNESGAAPYSITRFDAETVLLPVVWFRIIPGAHSFYTSSDDRFMWSYVFDRHLLGFPDDFTASSFKNILNLRLEFELFPELLYLGPVFFSGYYRNEYDAWRTSSSTGAMARISFGKFSINGCYAWDIHRAPLHGGFYLIAEGAF